MPYCYLYWIPFHLGNYILSFLLAPTLALKNMKSCILIRTSLMPLSCCPLSPQQLSFHFGACAFPSQGVISIHDSDFTWNSLTFDVQRRKMADYNIAKRRKMAGQLRLVTSNWAKKLKRWKERIWKLIMKKISKVLKWENMSYCATWNSILYYVPMEIEGNQVSDWIFKWNQYITNISCK